jgi:hypothetical protein
MAVDTKIAAAAATMKTFETQALTDLIAATEACTAAVDAILERFPEEAKAGAVYQCVAQSRGIAMNYQLENLKSQYGLNPVVAA